MKPYYEHGGITIYHGDCREMLPATCDLLLADPPYGAPSLLRGGSGTVRKSLRNAGIKMGYRHKVEFPMVGNDGPFDPQRLLNYPKVILWGANHYADRLPASAKWLIWDKREGITSNHGADCEMAWTASIPGQARLYRQLWNGMVRRGEENGKPRVHPTQKPIALMRWCITQAVLQPGSLILDPYAGSGPTLIAAYRACHRAIGIEIEERYCEIAAKRLAQDVLPLEQPA